ncbi:hypothetical protein LEMLEM_LOCUS19587 [Lemmus lemmus]
MSPVPNHTFYSTPLQLSHSTCLVHTLHSSLNYGTM